jgi:DNA processing protein
LDTIHRLGISVITPDDPHILEIFAALSDAPAVLYTMGDQTLLSGGKRIGIVGTRKPSAYGSMMAGAIASSLSDYGATIVSGFARGIDMIAQESVVSAGGKTIAVMGCGLDTVYPPENQALYRQMLDAGGLAVSEYPPGTPPLRHHFPQRNRLISALVQGLLLIEGQWKGGGLITVNHALEQGKEVFVLPGPVNHDMYDAPHALIRDGARLVTGAEDIAADMGWGMPCHVWSPQEPLTPEQAQIMESLNDRVMSFDEIAENTGMPAASLNSNLTILELMGIIKKSAGRLYIKAKRQA